MLAPAPAPDTDGRREAKGELISVLVGESNTICAGCGAYEGGGGGEGGLFIVPHIGPQDSVGV